MKAFLRRLFPSFFVIRHSSRTRPELAAGFVILDLPSEFGPRKRLGEVRALFSDPRQRELINAMVQVLWMNRADAEEKALAAASMDPSTGSGGGASFYLGGVEAVNNIMADVQRLLAESLKEGRTGERVEWTGTEAMKGWFRAEGIE